MQATKHVRQHLLHFFSRFFNFAMVDLKWWWMAMLGGSILLAIPGHSEIGGMIGDVVGHFFSAFLLAIVPIAGYWLFYRMIGFKEITYIVGASWMYLVLSQFIGL